MTKSNSSSKSTKKDTISLSEGEMELLNILWELGPSTLSDVHKKYPRKVVLTTIQTRLNRMVEKGALSRSDDYPARYTAVVEIQVASETFFEKIVRICKGSLAPLIAHLTRDRRQLTPEEIAMLRELIDSHERAQNEEKQES